MMVEKLVEALHDELDDVKKYMLLYAHAHENIAPTLMRIANEELSHACELVDLIHELGGEVSVDDMETVKQAETAVKK